MIDEFDAEDMRRKRSLEGAGVACPDDVGENSVNPEEGLVPGEGKSPG
jgi:hypothetical protein